MISFSDLFLDYLKILVDILQVLIFRFLSVAQWLIGRVLDSRQRGCGFELHRGHCFVFLSKTN